MSINQLDKLHEFDFWSMINSLKWGDQTTRCIAAKRYIMKNTPPYKVTAFRRIADNYANMLIKAYTSKLNSVYSYAEMYNGAFELIGFGRSEYDRYISNPIMLSTIIESIIDKEDDEKFVFALPLEDDFFEPSVIV
jgi:hypothetical protein